MNAPPTPNTRQLQLAAMHRQAAEAIDYLFAVASKCSEEDLRSEAIHWLANVGTRAGMRLHELAVDPIRAAETRRAAAESHFWPKIVAPNKADQQTFDKALPDSIIGSDRLRLGNASLDTLHVRWVKSFIEAMDFGRAAWQHAQEEWEANEHLAFHHKFTLDREVLIIARQLPALLPATLDDWCDALKKYLAHLFPNHALGTHPEWLAEAGRRKSRDRERTGRELMRDDPKELHAWTVGRMVATLRQLVKPKRATRQSKKLVGRKSRK